MARAPEGYGSHPLPGFRYVRDARVLGALHVGLRHESGSRVVIPSRSVLSLGERPDRIKLLTSCPACQQGLNRYKDSTGLEVRYIVEELIEERLGSGWQQRFTDVATRGGMERVLL